MLNKENVVVAIIIIGMWLFYAFLVFISNAMSIPIWTVGGILLLLGFIALAIIFGVITFALL
jgi:hypothetical protein